MAPDTRSAGLYSSEFVWKRRIAAPPSDEGGVVPGIDVTAMLHDAAIDLVTELFGANDLKSLSRLAARPVLQAISAVFNGPIVPETPVLIGATLGSLSERSFVLTTAVWLAENGCLLAHGTANFVIVDVASRRTVAVPDNVVGALRSLRPQSPLPRPRPTRQPPNSTS
ncbi:hypothetical protein [Mycobacterium sp.]|jgi:acyl-CoA thioesterase FadM|uniref:hypothetical protein n=1 Tax=Mycobacterium sp. TaxID=1785 RepID=UPI002639E085|nr:hypothetical protein [Mycobacterium sp.]